MASVQVILAVGLRFPVPHLVIQPIPLFNLWGERGTEICDRNPEEAGHLLVCKVRSEESAAMLEFVGVQGRLARRSSFMRDLDF